MEAGITITFAPEITREQAKAMVQALEDYWKTCGGQGFEVIWETCCCKPTEGLRSTHCPFHGPCNCSHGATCPNHHEPERFEKVREGFVW